MKRIYNQPTVTTVDLLGGSVMQVASPAPGGLPMTGSGDPIPGNTSGD